MLEIALAQSVVGPSQRFGHQDVVALAYENISVVPEDLLALEVRPDDGSGLIDGDHRVRRGVEERAQVAFVAHHQDATIPARDRDAATGGRRGTNTAMGALLLLRPMLSPT